MSERRILFWGVGILAGILIAWLTMPMVANAAELNIHYSIVNSQTKGNSVYGLIEVRVVNTTDHVINNVDLRLAQPARNSIEGEVFRFGSIPAKQGRIHVGRFVFYNDTLRSGKPILWSVDFDGSSQRDHKKATGIGKEDDRRGGRK